MSINPSYENQCSQLFNQTNTIIKLKIFKTSKLFKSLKKLSNRVQNSQTNAFNLS